MRVVQKSCKIVLSGRDTNLKEDTRMKYEVTFKYTKRSSERKTIVEAANARHAECQTKLNKGVYITIINTRRIQK